MKSKMNDVLKSIENEFETEIEKGARHYLEVNIGRHAEKMGFTDLKEAFGKSHAIVPLKKPRNGMKVRIDGRTFVNYVECESGMAVPGYVADVANHCRRPFVPNDSMICNFA